jgi:hypothetical protein
MLFSQQSNSAFVNEKGDWLVKENSLLMGFQFSPDSGTSYSCSLATKAPSLPLLQLLSGSTTLTDQPFLM